MPDQIDSFAEQPAPSALRNVTAILCGRITEALVLKVGCSCHTMKYIFTTWLALYKKVDHNTCRHLSAWVAYDEWYEQRQYGVQGLPSWYKGKTFEQHAKHASHRMGHEVDIHCSSYLPVSAEHMTREEAEAAAADAEPLPESLSEPEAEDQTEF